MGRRPLVPRWEYWLSRGAGLALIISLHVRLAWVYLITRTLGLPDSQFIVITWLLALLYLLGNLLPRAQGTVPLTALGIVTWIAVLTIPPRDLWWQASPMLRGDKPLWTLILAGAVLLVAIIVRLAVYRRTLSAITGMGRQRMRDWADGQPLYPRMTVKRILRRLGYDE